MKKAAFFILVFSSLTAYSQIQEGVKQPPAPKEQSSAAESTDVDYPGGTDAFRATVGKRIDVSLIRGVTGKISCTARFTVNADGDIENIKTFGPNEKFNREVERAISSVKTKWIPATRLGKPIKAMFTLPFSAYFD